jgi:hypothetical protein
MNRAEKNRENLCKVPDGKPLFSDFNRMYTVILNELKAVLKLRAQTEQHDAAIVTSMETTAQGHDFQKVADSQQVH